VVTLKNFPLSLRPEHIYPAGKGRTRQISGRIIKHTSRAIDVLGEHLDTSAIYRQVKIGTTADNRPLLAGKYPLNSGRLSFLLRKCKKAVVYIVSLGKRLDSALSTALDENISFGTTFDTVASKAVEEAAHYIEKHVSENLKPNEGLTCRYSPGYCDWPLTEQEKLFRIFPEGSHGVELGENYLMSPRKTISGIIGIMDKKQLSRYGNACIVCKRQECPHRRSPYAS
jgi:hypothetical protein